MKKKMLRPLNNWKKDKIYFPFYHQGEVYRTGIPDEKNSFHHSIQYGPQFINNSTDSDRKIQIQEMKNIFDIGVALWTYL